MERLSLSRLLLALAIALGLFYLTACASAPQCPACACQTCATDLNQCESDLNQCIDYVGKCQELLK
jgi:hypothetical protein